MWKMCVYIHKQKYLSLYIYDGYNIYVYTHFPVHLMDMCIQNILHIYIYMYFQVFYIYHGEILNSLFFPIRVPNPKLRISGTRRVFLAKAGQHGSMGLGCSPSRSQLRSHPTLFLSQGSHGFSVSNVSIESKKNDWFNKDINIAFRMPA